MKNIIFITLFLCFHFSYSQICPTGGTQKKPPKGILAGAITGQSEGIASSDPNAIIGPDGQPTKHWVSVKDRLPYTILYENDKSAGAPAKYIKITTPIEPKQDAATFQLGGFGFNSLTFSVPPNTPSYYNRLDCRDSLGLYVDVTAGYDVNTNEAFWELQSIDPVTLLPPTNPFIGLLLLQDSSKPTTGHGFVNFSIKPKTTAVTLDTIVAHASILFDSNDTILTNLHKNAIDAFAPTSNLNNITAVGANKVVLSWTGADDTGGSGIKSYTLYVSTNSTSFYILKAGIIRTDTTIKLAPDSSYCFFVLATDSVDNVEILRPSAIKCVTVGSSVLPITWLYFNGTKKGKNNLLQWATATENNSKAFHLERSITGRAFARIATIAAKGNSTIKQEYAHTDVGIDQLNSSVLYYRLKEINLDGSYTYSNIIRLNYDSRAVFNSIVYPNPTSGYLTVALGDNRLIGSLAMVVDLNGKIMQQVKLSSPNQTFNFSGFTNGIYFIRLKNKETLKVEKF